MIELKGTSSDPPPRELVKGESPEVQAYCRWWSQLCQDDAGVWVLSKTSPPSARQEAASRVRLVPLPWRLGVWRVVHVNTCSHLGFERVYEIIRERFIWPNMAEDIRLMCKSCLICQRGKPGMKGAKFAMKHEFVNHPHARVGIDLQGPLEVTARGNRYICVIQDYFSKRMELYALPDKTAGAVASVLFHEYISRYGAMETLHSDQGLEFDNQLMEQLCALYGIDKTRTCPYAPWSNGLVERSNRVIKSIIRALSAEKEADWDELLPSVYAAYNATPHASTGFTPHRLFFSQCADPLLPVDLMYGCVNKVEPPCYSAYVLEQRWLALQAAETVRRVTGKAVELQSRTRDHTGLREWRFAVGDRVFYYYPPAAANKLDPSPWTGPHTVIQLSNVDQMFKIRRCRPNEHRGRGRKPVEEQWVSAAFLKPVQEYRGEGVLLAAPALRHDSWRTEMDVIGYCSKLSCAPNMK